MGNGVREATVPRDTRAHEKGVITLKRHIRKRIKEDLLSKLEYSGCFGEYYLDLIEHYMELVDIKEKLQADIRKNGLRMEVLNGNGVLTTKSNESVERLVKVSGQMMKILSELGLKTPMEATEKEDL